MRFNKIIFIIVIVIICFDITRAQDDLIPEIVPPSPEAASLAKFTEIPVSHYTGLPTINIPFYNIDIDGLNIPIGISYHSRGVLVEEIASRTGIGWALNAGGAITRQIRGKADDINGGSGKGYLFENFYDDFNTNENTREQVYNDDINKIADLVPDQFSFNFLGYSGKFILDYETNQPLMQSFSDIKIEPIFESEPTRILAWVVTTENGFKFYFGESHDRNPDRIARNNDQTMLSQMYSTYSGLTNLDSENNGVYNNWSLIEIISPNEEHVKFYYQEENPIFYRRSYDKKESVTDNLGEQITHIKSMFSKIRSKQYQISEIRFEKGRVIFHKSDILREDLDFGYSLGKVEIQDFNGNLVNQYVLNYSYSEDPSNANALSYLLAGDPKASKRMFLESITKTANGKSQPPYLFEYTNKDEMPNRFSNSQDLWGYYNGKNNGQFLTFDDYRATKIDRTVDTLKAKTGLLSKVTYPTGGYANYTFEANKALPPHYFTDLFFTDINPGTSKSIGMMKDVLFLNQDGDYELSFTINEEVANTIKTNVQFMGDYGTCSSTQTLADCKYQVSIVDANQSAYNVSIFMGEADILTPPPGNYKLIVRVIGYNDPNDFENSFAISLSWKEKNALETDMLYSGGNRIKKIEIDGLKGKKIIRTYEYKKEDGTSSGLVFSLPGYYYIQTELNGIPVVDQYGACPGSPLTYQQGNHVGYSDVTEYVTNSEETNSAGKTKYRFTSMQDGGVFWKFPYTVSMDNEWLRGKPQSIEYFKWDQGAYWPVKKNLYSYKYADFITHSEITNPPYMGEGEDLVRVLDKLKFKIPLIIFYYDENTPSESRHNDYKVYYLTGGVQQSFKEEEIVISDMGMVSSESTHYYNNIDNYQRIGTETKTSDDKIISKKIYYPHDASQLEGLSTTASAAIESLLAQDRIAEQLQVENIVKKTDNTILSKSTQRTNYKNDLGNNLVLPEIIQTLSGEYNATTNPFIDRVIFHGYYPNGKVKEVSKKDDTPIVYFWGYNNQYPIAKIQGKTYSEISSSAIDEIVKLDDENIDLDLINQNIRDALPNCFVNTYTYKPLTGISSSTDYNGKTTYYDYDDFGRLEYIKDYESNILKKYAYEYQSINSPTGFGSNNKEINQIDLIWDEIQEIEEYRLYLVTVDSKVLIYSGLLNTYLHTSLNPNTSYNYELTYAKNGMESSPASYTETTDMLPPGEPSLELYCSSQSVIQLSWDDVENEEGYYIYEGPDSEPVQTLGANATSYTFTGLQAGTTYSYRIETFNRNNTVSSLNQSITTIPPNPLSIAGEISPCMETLQTYTVQIVLGATEYQWEIPSGWNIESGQGNQSITVFTGTTNGTIRVRAGNSSGYSSYYDLTVAPQLVEPIMPIGGPDKVMANSTNTFQVMNEPGSSDFEWTVPKDCNIISGQNTSTVIVRWGAVAGEISVNFLTGTCEVNGTKTVTIKTPQPPAPPVLSLSCSSSSVIELEWNDVANEIGYHLFRNMEMEAFASLPAGTTSYSDEGLDGASIYSYRVVAYNNDGSTPSLTHSITTISEAPVLNSAVDVSNTRIDVSWTNVSGELGYWLYIGTLPRIAVNPNVTSYSVTGLSSNTTYAIKVTSYNATGESEYSNTLSCKTKLDPPGTPTLNLSCSNSSEISLSWTNVSGESGYRIYRSTSSSNVNALINTLSANSTSYTNSGLNAGTTYYYKVQAYNADYYKNSSTKSMLTAPSTPETISGTTSPCLNANVNYTISAVLGATSYQWVVPSGWTINYTSQGGRVINVKAGVASGNIQVRATNSTGSSSYRSKSVTPLNVQPTTYIGGPDQVASGSTNTFQVLVAPGSSSFSWNVPSGCTIQSGQGTSTVSVRWGSSAGTISVSFLTGTCSVSGQKSVSISSSGGGGGGGISDPFNN